MSNFEKSDIYEKALTEYQDKVYGQTLKPLHTIVVDDDEVYLFYPQSLVLEIFEILKEKYEDLGDFPIFLGYQEPELRTVKFMGVEYKTILLWYDNCEVPRQFQANL